jgi:hypothetical protein
MSKTFMMQPVLPVFQVTQVDADNIKEFVDFARIHPDKFPALKNVGVERICQEEDKAFIPGLPGHDNVVICEVGSYLVISENGYRHFTESRIVKHGVVADFPQELFFPIEAVLLPEAKKFV